MSDFAAAVAVAAVAVVVFKENFETKRQPRCCTIKRFTAVINCEKG